MGKDVDLNVQGKPMLYVFDFQNKLGSLCEIDVRKVSPVWRRYLQSFRRCQWKKDRIGRFAFHNEMGEGEEELCRYKYIV